MKKKLHPVERFMSNEAFVPFDPTARAVTVDARALRAAVRRLVRELAEIGAQETDESDGRPDDVRAANPRPARQAHGGEAVSDGVVLNAPHGWVRIATYGAQWHRATCAGTAACGRPMRARGEVERATLPSPAKHAADGAICSLCFLAAIGARCQCSCSACACAHAGKEPDHAR